MNIKNKVSAFLITFTALNIFSTGFVFAQSDTYTEHFENKSPFYVLVTMGNYDGCEQVGLCEQHKFKGSLTVKKGQITMARQFLIYSNEVLDNDVHDIGVPAQNLDFEFSTPFYKGFIFKLYPDKDSGFYDVVNLSFVRDGFLDRSFDIPFNQLTLNPNISGPKDTVITFGKYVKVRPLFQDIEITEKTLLIRYKLEIIKYLLGLEKYTRSKFLAGEVRNINYMQLQGIWEVFWSDTFKPGPEQYSRFKSRYYRLKKMLNNGKTSLPRFIGGINVLFSSLQ